MRYTGDISILGNVFDCQAAPRVPQESHNDSRNLATSSGIHRREGIEKSGSENHCNQYLYLAFPEKQRKKSGRQQLSEVHDSPCRGYRDLYLGKFSDHAEFQSWIVNFRTEVCSKAKNPTRALQWIKEIEAAKSLDDLITPKSITGKDFHDREELDLMMASALKRCYDKQIHSRQMGLVQKETLVVFYIRVPRETEKHQRKK